MLYELFGGERAVALPERIQSSHQQSALFDFYLSCVEQPACRVLGRLGFLLGALLQCLFALFAIDFLCFQYFLASFAKTGGWGILEPFELNRSSASHFPGFNVA
jgi:hypothetical protein